MRVTPESGFLGSLEHELIQGKARWLAEFNESFRNVRLDDLDFEMIVEGSTRGASGYLFSAILSRTMLPAYAASCFVKVLRGDKNFDLADLERYLVALRSYVKSKEARWSFLVLVHAGSASSTLKQKIESLRDDTIGVAMVNISNMEVTHNSSRIGRSTLGIIPKKWSPNIDLDSAIPDVPDEAQARQWGKLAFVFGVSLMGLTGLSFLVSAFLIGALVTNRGGLLVNVALASLIAYWYSRARYYNRMSLTREGITLQNGRNKPTFTNWSNFDLVSLKHLGGGQFDVRLYRAGDHKEFLSVPVSGIKLDPSGFRWKAMQLCRHGNSHYVKI